MKPFVLIERKCLTCGDQITGRADKKYCSDECRTTAHNKTKADNYHSPIVRNTTNALIKNRRILQTVLADQETIKANKDSLSKMGFNFKFFTSLHITNNSKTYYYCFDYGYLPLANDWYLIVRDTKKDKDNG